MNTGRLKLAVLVLCYGLGIANASGPLDSGTEAAPPAVAVEPHPAEATTTEQASRP